MAVVPRCSWLVPHQGSVRTNGTKHWAVSAFPAFSFQSAGEFLKLGAKDLGVVEGHSSGHRCYLDICTLVQPAALLVFTRPPTLPVHICYNLQHYKACYFSLRPLPGSYHHTPWCSSSVVCASSRALINSLDSACWDFEHRCEMWGCRQ